MDAQQVFDYAGKEAMSLDEFLASTNTMEQHAQEAMPYTLTDCTFDKGAVKQPIWSCITCQKANGGQFAGICATCSVQCHAEHEQVELFSRRDFQCDCGTTRIGPDAVCNAGKRLGQQPNEGNHYDNTFKNEFCYCGRIYNPLTEDDEMIQCLACENWFHSHHVIPIRPDYIGPERDEENKLSQDNLLLGLDDFDTLICSACVKKPDLAKILDRYAGKASTGAIIVTKDLGVLGELDQDADDDEEAPAGTKSRKRGHQEDSDYDEDDGEGGAAPKRVKTADGSASEIPKPAPVVIDPQLAAWAKSESSAPNQQQEAPASPSRQNGTKRCKAPSPNILPEFQAVKAQDGYKANVYLQEGFRDRWCRCPDCIKDLERFPWLLEEETSLELAEDAEPEQASQ